MVAVDVARVAFAEREDADPVVKDCLLAEPFRGLVAGDRNLVVEVEDGANGDVAGRAAPLADLLGGDELLAGVLEDAGAVRDALDGVVGEVGVEDDVALLDCRRLQILGSRCGLGECAVVVDLHCNIMGECRNLCYIPSFPSAWPRGKSVAPSSSCLLY